MKQLFRLNNLMLAMIMTASITTSCVESEQNPFDSGVEDGSGNFIDAQLPDPEYINFSIGDEVIVKGSGFTDSDKIFIHNYEYEYNEDADGNGDINPISVEAKIKSCTSDKLIFIVPGESNLQYNSIVYLERNNKEYKLGEIYINNHAYYVSKGSNRELIVVNDKLSGDEKVYYQNIQRDNDYNEFELIGEKQEFNTIISRDENEIHINNKYALGEFMVFIEKNGEFAPCGIINTDIDEMIRVNNNSFQPGQKCTIEGIGFLDDDRIILKDTYNNEQEIEVSIVDREYNNSGKFPE